MNENISLKKERCGYEGCKKKLGVIGGLLCKCEKNFVQNTFMQRHTISIIKIKRI